MAVAKSHNLLEYLDRRLGRHTGGGPEYHYYCPACIDRIGSESDGRKLAVNLRKKVGQCWRCEFKFRDIRFLFRYINGGYVTVEEKALLRRDPPLIESSVREAVKEALGIRRGTPKEAKLRAPRFPSFTKPLTRENRKERPWRRAHEYLEERGFGIDDVLRFDLHYCPRGVHAGHIIFPVYQGGERVYWTTRWAGKNAPLGMKSRNPEKRDGYVSRERVLLNYDACVGERLVALVEGPLDTVAAYPVGLGLLGKEMSVWQRKLIEALVEAGLEELVLMLDMGTATKVDELRDELRDIVPTVSTLYFPDERDPADLRLQLPELIEGRVVDPGLGMRLRARLGRKSR